MVVQTSLGMLHSLRGSRYSWRLCGYSSSNMRW
jgi:hypothetical protein